MQKAKYTTYTLHDRATRLRNEVVFSRPY